MSLLPSMELRDDEWQRIGSHWIVRRIFRWTRSNILSSTSERVQIFGTIKEDWDAQGLVQPVRCQRVKASQTLSQWSSKQRKTLLAAVHLSEVLWMVEVSTCSTQDPQVVLFISFTDLLLPNVPLPRCACTQPRFG